MTANSFALRSSHLPDPRGILATLYAAGATPWKDFGQRLGLTFFKFGITTRRDFRDRYLDLSERRYGAVIATLDDRSRTIYDHPRGDEVFGTRLSGPAQNAGAAALLAILPHASFSNGTVQFRLPPGLDSTAVEQRFQKLLLPRNLNTWLASEEAQERLVRAGYPARTRLFSDYNTQGHAVDHITMARRSLCSELFCIFPKYELKLLLMALVQALQDEAEFMAEKAKADGQR